MSPVAIQQIATVVPEKFYTQEFGLNFLLKLLGTTERRRTFLTKIYQGSAIHKRHSVIADYDKEPADYEFFPKNPALLPEPDTQARNELYIREANRLAVAAVRALLEKTPSLKKSDITHLITVSCTGFSAPGFDFQIMKALELPAGVHRFHLGFMGCYAAFPAMKLAKDICTAHPAAKVVVVNLELCSLHFQQKFDPDIVIANAIFGDGVSAALISATDSDAPGARIVLHDFFSRCLPKSEGDMAWAIGQHGFDMKLSAYVPKLVDENILPIMEGLFAQAGVARSDIRLWAIHPGGRAILDKLEVTLGLTREDLKIPYDILWEYGNMSSATIMFVLQRFLEDKACGKMFAVGFGPGLTIETGYLEKTAC
jgi:predicted naringenin-chalcone synthase